MKLTWKDWMLNALMYDERGKIVGEILDEDASRRFAAIVNGAHIGYYISREHARKAIEAEVTKDRA
jgi:hypothetical protein